MCTSVALNVISLVLSSVLPLPLLLFPFPRLHLEVAPLWHCACECLSVWCEIFTCLFKFLLFSVVFKLFCVTYLQCVGRTNIMLHIMRVRSIKYMRIQFLLGSHSYLEGICGLQIVKKGWRVADGWFRKSDTF